MGYDSSRMIVGGKPYSDHAMEQTRYKALLAKRAEKRTKKKRLTPKVYDQRRGMLKRRKLWNELRDGQKIQVCLLNGKDHGIAYGLNEYLLVLVEGRDVPFKPEDVRRVE
jgi:hypothetical protein